MTPSPAMDGRLHVRFELRDGSPARLELLDLAGRLVSSCEVGRFGPGLHEFSPSGRLRAGVYFVRLTQGALSDRTRIVVLQ